MNKQIVQLLDGAQAWGLDLFIWYSGKLFKKCKADEYRVIWSGDFLTVVSTVHLVRDKWGYEDFEIIKIFHYMEISSIKIKHRLNIIFEGSVVYGTWSKD